MSEELNAVVQREVGVLEEGGKIKVSDYGLEVVQNLSPEEWCNSVQTIGKYNSKAQFYLGDLVVYAEGINNAWGEKYDELVELTGYEMQTLNAYAVVARQFSPSFREEVYGAHHKLSWEHFRRVLGLDLEVAKYFLKLAGEAGWSTRRLADEVARHKNGGKLPVEHEEPIGYRSFKEIGKKMMKDFVPSKMDEEYDEVSWLLEIKDWVDFRLEELGAME